VIDLPFFLKAIFIIIFGLVLGSFTTCIIYRLPRGLSIWKSETGSHRSMCPACHHILTARELVPVVSWVLQKGRCRHCGKPMGGHYPIIETCVLILVMGLFAVFGVSVTAFLSALIIPVLAGLAAFGLKKRLF
jgi:leader peptidase (prepilin peptidase) / N-methyltransferase